MRCVLHRRRRTQGTKLEQLIVEYFHTDPTLQVTYDEVQGQSSRLQLRMR